LQEFNAKQGIFNYPNPFSTETNVVFYNDQTSKIAISLYNLAGMKVMNISEKSYSKGENTITLKRSGLSSGNYILVIKGDNFERNSKLITVQ
jgi:hypothetical protein